ncbi:GNAT family N-acetyltransferase [Lactobacillus sp. DCY120]|uniref:GNAT family N-acetyltransferase n=1 Tax=Bombilactobacillus apium TaxID=2675299 RepID=A0A850R1Z3_9LACO|nr:GNAT family N-acetyltransferase [Bombilactobacillus apium]NVY96943.1 GNAT family N-acetyltransferase [Bombilactobacillus apium]
MAVGGQTNIYSKSNCCAKGWKRQGIGTKLWQKALRIAQTKGKSIIWLGVWEHNLAAQRFYAQLGLQRVDQHTFQLGSDLQTDLILEKKIN